MRKITTPEFDYLTANQSLRRQWVYYYNISIYNFLPKREISQFAVFATRAMT